MLLTSVLVLLALLSFREMRTLDFITRTVEIEEEILEEYKKDEDGEADLLNYKFRNLTSSYLAVFFYKLDSN